MSETRPKKDKNQHIQVFVRVRPSNNSERISKSPSVIDVQSCKEVVVKERPQDKLTKKFTFDRVFGPESKQVEVYNAVVSPLLDEVLAGYNCTVFAYGQTGTGKTFTMEGCGNDPTLHWQSDTMAGIIPRSLSHLFDELRTLDAQEYSVRVSFLELYNEELFDLLSPSDDASKIRLYEDATRKGAVIIHGLEEVTVHNKSEVYKILEKGSEKRQTAATLMNAQSSRSHTVFSITVHIKENTVDGEELLKTGKLNLVDLAGSENVGRSGAVDRRAREAGNINQSLLTLGRVITALVERAPHIPYRESKLTRLLQESLGGRTKTSIIATVSPASINLEETLSTLDYAYRAKNITNRPEINQKLSKKALLKEYTEEIERLRRDLLATRERNGVYIAQENYNDMQSTIDYQGKEIEEKINHIKALEEAALNKEKLFNELQMELDIQTTVLRKTKDQLESTKIVLKTTKDDLHTTKYDRDVQKHLVEKHAKTEEILYSQAKTLLKVADTASDDTYKLHDKIFRKKRVEEENENLGQLFRDNIGQRFGNIEIDLSNYTQNLVQFCMTMKNQLLAQAAVSNEGNNTFVQLSKDLVLNERSLGDALKKNVNTSYDELNEWVETQVKNASSISEKRTSELRELVTKVGSRIQELCDNEASIAENLRIVKEENAKKFDNMLMYVKDWTETLCETVLADRDRMSGNISELRKFVETIKQTHEQKQRSKKEIAKALRNFVHKFESYNEEDDTLNSLITKSLNSVDQKHKDISEQTESNCNKRVDNGTAFEKEIRDCVSAIKTDVASNMEKNRKIAADTISQSELLFADVEKEINKNCEILNTYKNLVESNAKDIHDRTESDRNTIVNCINNLEKIVSDASVNHVELIEQQRHKADTSNADMGRKFENQSIEATEWHVRVTSSLRTTKHQVDKFLVEDLRRDQPTGSTPAKKEFEYPRKLVKTSPHERIVRRFQQMNRKSSEESYSEEDSTMLCAEAAMHRNSDSPNRRRISLITPPKVRSTSTPYDKIKSKLQDVRNNDSKMYGIVRSASTSDLQVTTARSSLDVSTRSECDLSRDVKNNNKENGTDEFAKPQRKVPAKLRPSKTKVPSRSILGSSNG